MSAPEEGRVYSVDGAVVMLVQMDDGLTWYGRDRDGDVVDYYAKGGDGPRPLVVIDPEDREQVVRLAVAYIATWEGAYSQETAEAITTRQMQAALREFAQPTPPKPEEPLGTGAVVEDADGERWLRMPETVPGPWCHWPTDGHPRSDREYADIDAVTVLSEGVQP